MLADCPECEGFGYPYEDDTADCPECGGSGVADCPECGFQHDYYDMVCPEPVERQS